MVVSSSSFLLSLRRENENKKEEITKRYNNVTKDALLEKKGDELGIGIKILLEQKGKIIKEWWLNPNKIEDKRVDFLILCVLNGKEFIYLFIFQIGGGMNMKGNGNGNGNGKKGDGNRNEISFSRRNH